MFLHGGLIHLALNMYALNAIGPLVEIYFGKAKYLIIYFISGILSSYFSYLFSSSVSIGASGAIFGILGATLIIAYTNRKKGGKEFLNNIISVIVVNLILGFSIPNVDNFGHIGGLIGGVIITFVLFYPMTTRSNTPIALCESDSHQIEDFGFSAFLQSGSKERLRLWITISPKG
ncbi:rhomboid family intramembrane serine protease [Clostridium botulinum]|nr:rhomboid family intramembrane serine protease [Clostridium botulinum]